MQEERGTPAPPQRAVVLLRQGIYPKSQTHRRELQAELPPLVEPGAKVKAGTVIARSDSGSDEVVSTPIHSPISGEVVAIEERAHPWGGRSQAVVIASDGRDEWERLPTSSTTDPERLTPQELQRILYEAGVTDGGNAGFPTEFGSSPISPEQVDCLLVGAVGDEPYLRYEHLLLERKLREFLAGLAVMRRALGERVEVHLGLNREWRGLIARLVRESPEWLAIHPLPPKYPQGDEELLVRSILGVAVPPGGLAAEEGIVVQDVAHVLAAYEAVHEGKPFIERWVAQGGPALARPGVCRLRMGTPLSALLGLEGEAKGEGKGKGRKGGKGKGKEGEGEGKKDKDEEVRLLLDGVLRGFPVEDPETPILRNTSAVVALPGPRLRLLAWSEPGLARDSYTRAFLALPLAPARRADFGLHGPERPCVKCGFCLEACPQGLAPATLAECAAHDLLDEAKELNIFACIECGLCSYVCVAKLPLLEQIRAGKRKLKEEE